MFTDIPIYQKKVGGLKAAIGGSTWGTIIVFQQMNSLIKLTGK